MSDLFPELEVVRITVSTTTRERHLAAIDQAISTSTARWRPRRLLTVAVATLLLVPVLAVAAKDSVPGDFLYPVKRALEPVIGLIDDDVAEQNRAREVEAMIRRRLALDAINDHIDVALETIRRRQSDVATAIERVDAMHRAAETLSDHTATDRAATHQDTLERLLEELRRTAAELEAEKAGVDGTRQQSDEGGPVPATDQPTTTVSSTTTSRDDTDESERTGDSRP